MFGKIVSSRALPEHILLSILSGCLGALSGLLGKLGLDQSQLEGFHGAANISLRILNIGGTLFLNFLMLTTYAKALKLAPTAAEASLLNTASNLILTAVVSMLVFEEQLSLQWMLGTVLVCCGVALVMEEDKCPEKVKEKES